MRTVTAETFEAECLAMIDEVEASREVVIITKDGKAAWRLEPVGEKLSTPTQAKSQND